jgi:hypothetical protein
MAYRIAPLLLLAIAAIAADRPRAKASVVRVPVRVAGEGPITASELAVRIDGAESSVERVKGPGDDLLLILVLDLSGELAEANAAKEALVQAVRALPPNVAVAVLRAQDGLSVAADPAADRDTAVMAISESPVSGKAGLIDTIEEAARLADSILNKSPVRVAVLYATDSNVYNYREDFTNPVINSSDQRDLSRRFPEGLIREKISKVDDKLASFQAPLFVVHLDYRSDQLNEAYQRGLMQIADSTGGASAFCRGLADIPVAVASMFEAARSTYVVDVRLPARPPKILPLEVESGGRQVSFRSRFVVPEK